MKKAFTHAIGNILCLLGFHDLKYNKSGHNCKRCDIRYYLRQYDRDHYITKAQDSTATIFIIGFFIWILLIVK